MPEIAPPQLAELLDVAERPRAADWSLRAALTRYGQPQPQRASNVMEVVRRVESALRPHTKAFEQDGHAIWRALQEGGSAGIDSGLSEVLRVVVELDRLADLLAAWAVARATERPDAKVDEVVGDLSRRLDALGVPREEGPRPGGTRA